MTIFDVLRHRWKNRWRSATPEWSLLSTALLVLAGLQFSILLTGVGWFYPQIAKTLVPDRDPLRLLDSFMLYGFGGLAATRFFLQSSVRSTAQPYLSLPIPRSRISKILHATSSLSPLNLFPIVLLSFIWLSTVLPSSSLSESIIWAIGVYSVVFLTHFSNTIFLTLFNLYPLLFSITIFLLITFFNTKILLLQELSEWVFGGLRHGRVPPLIVIGIGTIGSVVSTHQITCTQLYYNISEWRLNKSLFPLSIFSLLARNVVTNRVVSLVTIDLKLILRNKRPRQMLLAGIPFIGAFFLLLTSDPPPVNRIIFCFIASSYMGLTYIQYGYAWHGNHYDRLATQAIQPEMLITSLFITFSLLCTLNFLVILPYSVFIPSHFSILLLCFFIYNLGFTSFFSIPITTISRKAIEINTSTIFNYQGTYIFHFSIFLIPLFIPIIIYILYDIKIAYYSITVLGIVGIFTAPLWIRGIGNLLHWQRHSMISGFRGN